MFWSYRLVVLFLSTAFPLKCDRYNLWICSLICFRFQNKARLRKHQQSFPNERLAASPASFVQERKCGQIIGQFHSWGVFPGLSFCVITRWLWQHHRSEQMTAEDRHWCCTKLMKPAISRDSLHCSESVWLELCGWMQQLEPLISTEQLKFWV